MSRLAYIWVLVAVGFAFWFHAHEEAQRRHEINAAVRNALVTGARTGCKTNNDVRQQIEGVAARLHPEYKVTLEKQDCYKTIRLVLHNYERHLHGKP